MTDAWIPPIESGRGIAFTVDPGPTAPPDDGPRDGDYVTAAIFTAADGPRVAFGATPSDRQITGYVTLRWVETTHSWRYSINGRTIDPATARPAAIPRLENAQM
jgi:hypothetical protein